MTPHITTHQKTVDGTAPRNVDRTLLFLHEGYRVSDVWSQSPSCRVSTCACHKWKSVRSGLSSPPSISLLCCSTFNDIQCHMPYEFKRLAGILAWQGWLGPGMPEKHILLCLFSFFVYVSLDLRRFNVVLLFLFCFIFFFRVHTGET